MRLAFLISGIFLCLGFTSCHKEQEDVPLNMGYEYIPCTEGSWIIYHLDTVKIQGLATDTVCWEIKDVYHGYVFNPDKSESSIFITRFHRADSSLPWSNEVSFSEMIKTPSQVLLREDNVLYQRCVFPVQEGARWDGNAYNSLDSQEYTLQEVGKAATVSGMNFSNTIKIIEKDITTLISQDITDRLYAAEIGMIYVRVIHITNLQSVQNRSGFISELKVKSWGKE
jgi:hypothetical protein